MSAVVVLAPESVDAVAKRVLELQTASPVRPELTTEEAAKYCGFALVDTFRRWAKRRRIAPIERGRWRVAALNRAMGA
ncbi:MAG TPA: hypothetical protein VK163_05530 [Opitutaceae bacterium]|nr:hypothetical protein [Opitutaceae bacterium]